MAQPSPHDPERGTPFTVSAAPAAAGAPGLRLEGELDLQGVPIFEAAAAGLAPDARVDVDLRELAFMDSSGVAALIKLDQRLRPGGGGVRCLVPPDGPVRKLVELTQLGEVLEVAEAPAAAGIDPESRVREDAGG
jgi:anti-sigma B factor antagonist